MDIYTSKGKFSIAYKTRRRYRGEPICADPTVDLHENETALYFSMADRRLWISSYEPKIIEGLLSHADFKVEQLVLMRIDGRDCVVGVMGRLPVRVLTIGRARASDGHELIFKKVLSPSVRSSVRTQKPRKKRARSAKISFSKRPSRRKRRSERTRTRRG